MSHVAVAATGKKLVWLHFAYKHPTLLSSCLTDSHNTIQYIPCGKDDLKEIGFLDMNGTGSG
jgi:hypothetical protein